MSRSLEDAALYSNLEPHQEVTFYPTFAYRSRSQLGSEWTFQVAGMAYRQGDEGFRYRIFMRLMQRLLRGQSADIASDPMFQSRIRGFLVQPQRACRIVLKIGNEQHEQLAKSKRNGHFRGAFVVNEQQLQRWQPEILDQSHGFLQLNVVLPPGDARLFSAPVQFLAAKGISVISDIDDTIKVTDVAHRDQLLYNTFLNPFRTVPGMAQLFRQWEACGAAFHYVSSSPWQLFEPLKQLLEEGDFPRGSMHLRSIRFRDPSVLKLFVSRKRNKFRVIRSIIRAFPERRFVLVGDSGEQDPEIYGAIARRYPSQIDRILIRRVTGRRWTRRRCRRAFRQIPLGIWRTFRHSTQLQDIGLFDHPL